MKRILAIAVLGLMLAGCATLGQIGQTLQTVTTATVTPSQALFAANSFNAIQSGVTGYYTYCDANPTASACLPDTLRTVNKANQAGRQARNQIETYILNSTNAPAALYNTIVAAVKSLQASPAANYVSTGSK